MPNVPEPAAALAAVLEQHDRALRALAVEAAALWMNMDVPHGADVPFTLALSNALNLVNVGQEELHLRAEQLARMMNPLLAAAEEGKGH